MEEERVSPTWLILQRLEDLRRGQDELKSELKTSHERLEHRIESVRYWSLGLMFLAVFGLLTKLLIPGT